MKKLLLISLTASMAVVISCSDNSSEDPEIDCTQSDIALTVSGQTEPDCDTEGSIEVTGSGGTAPYEFSIDGTTFQSATTFSNVAAGSYTITIRDDNGCTATVSTTLASGPDGITLTLVPSDAECGDPTGSIMATAVGGDGNYSFALDGGDGQTSGEFTGVSNGSRTVVVTDGTGCSVTKTVIVSSGTSWVTDIKPIIDSNCAVSGCHNGDNTSIPNWTVFSNVQNRASDIKTRTGNRSMPQAGSGLTLTDEEIELIACWVDDGAQNN